MRRCLIPLAALALAAASAGGAQAATVAIDGDTLRFRAAPGEANYPTFHHRAEDELVVYDFRFPGPSVTAGPGCAQDGENTVLCPRPAVARAAFELLDAGDDDGVGDLLNLTADVPVPVSVTAAEGAAARVSYIDSRPVRALLDGLPNDGPPGRGDNIGPGVDHVSTGGGADTIGGNDRANRVYAGWGDDSVAGGAGDDTITLAAYNDVGADAVGLETHGTDEATCGPGFDTIYLDERDRAAGGDCELVVLVLDYGYAYGGGPGADRIIADRGPAFVQGRGGDDRLGVTRFAGSVTIFGGDGDDRVAGNVSDDRLEGGTGDDSVLGAEGADRIVGNRGRDSLSGGAGGDTISARDGFTDTVRCGSGRDTVSADRRDRVARDCERVRR
jgi:Ca2+-binding RTX toxin-like protein